MEVTLLETRCHPRAAAGLPEDVQQVSAVDAHRPVLWPEVGLHIRGHQGSTLRVAQLETWQSRTAGAHLFAQSERVEHHQAVGLQQDARPYGSKRGGALEDDDAAAGLPKRQRRGQAGYAATGDRNFKSFRHDLSSPIGLALRGGSRRRHR